MTAIAAAYYEGLAADAADTVRVFRAFGYHAAAAAIDKRRKHYERMAAGQKQETPQDVPACGVSDLVETMPDSSTSS